jgi:hypothetical protein
VGISRKFRRLEVLMNTSALNCDAIERSRDNGQGEM